MSTEADKNEVLRHRCSARDTAVVVLDLLVGMTYYHDGSELGDIYAELYQLVAQRLLADEQSQQVTTKNAVDFLNTFYRLPEADRQILRVLLNEVLGVDICRVTSDHASRMPL